MPGGGSAGPEHRDGSMLSYILCCCLKPVDFCFTVLLIQTRRTLRILYSWFYVFCPFTITNMCQEMSWPSTWTWLHSKKRLRGRSYNVSLDAILDFCAWYKPCPSTYRANKRCTLTLTSDFGGRKYKNALLSKLELVEVIEFLANCSCFRSWKYK